jgi:hypothetical protein
MKNAAFKKFETHFFINDESKLAKVAVRTHRAFGIEQLRKAFLKYHVLGLTDPEYPREIFIFTRELTPNSQPSTLNH